MASRIKFLLLVGVLIVVNWFPELRSRDAFKNGSKRVRRTGSTNNQSNLVWSDQDLSNLTRLESYFDEFLITINEVAPVLNKYVISKSGCDHRTKLVILIFSSAINFDRRAAIRETWLSRSTFGDQIKVFFLIGLSSQTGLRAHRKIVQEERLNHDLIQFPFLDTYRNLTIKSLLMLNWIQTNCNQSKFAIKVDDDMYLDIDQLFVKLSSPQFVKLSSTSSIIGFRSTNAVVNRIYTNPVHPQFIPSAIYKSDSWPDFLTGPIYIITQPAISKLFETGLRSLPGLCLEDVFITGFVADLADVNRVQFNQQLVNWNCKSTNVQSKMIIGHNCRMSDLNRIYNAKSRRVVFGVSKIRLPTISGTESMAISYS